MLPHQANALITAASEFRSKENGYYLQIFRRNSGLFAVTDGVVSLDNDAVAAFIETHKVYAQNKKEIDLYHAAESLATAMNNMKDAVERNDLFRMDQYFWPLLSASPLSNWIEFVAYENTFKVNWKFVKS